MSKFKPAVEVWDINKVKPYDKNAKIHTETQISALVSVIKTQGWDVPIVVDKDGVVIKGHGRRLAALSMGLKEVPVIVRRDMSEAQVKAARLSDNRVAMGDFDVDAIKDELEALKTDGFDLSTMGFDDKEVKMMLGELDAMDFGAFVESKIEESETSTNPGDELSTPEPAKPEEKPFLITDVLGFKHIPGKYKNDIVEFLVAAEQASEMKGAEAFGELIKRLNEGLSK
jgi:ParB-like nuclease domain